MRQPEIRVFNSTEELFQSAATEFVTLAQAAIRANGKFTVALSGGSTPKGMYRLLANRTDIPWDKTYFFFSDERHVPPSHPESNYRMAYEAMLSKVPPGNVFRMHGENPDADAAAADYELTLKSFFQLRTGDFPRFDLILLGLGPDGHTASLFPGSAALKENKRLVVANWVEEFHTHRITFTFPVLNNSACVMFLVSGKEKAPALHQVLEGGTNLPAMRVRPTDGRLLWLLDAAAAPAGCPTSRF